MYSLCWLVILIFQYFLPCVDSECTHNSVYVQGPAEITGVFKVITPGNKSGTAHGNRPIYESVGSGQKHYLYFADGFWIFGEDELGGTENYYCADADKECPDDTSPDDWLTPAQFQVSIAVTQVSSAGMCPERYPFCEKGDCRNCNNAKCNSVAASFAPDPETPPGGPLHPGVFNAIKGVNGGPVRIACDQQYQACPKLYPVCTAEKKCVIEECRAGIGLSSQFHSACQSTQIALTPDTIPWKCSEPWRCPPKDSDSTFNMINGFNGKGIDCTGDFQVRPCPEGFPVCDSGNCIKEECKSGNACSSANVVNGFDGHGTTCNQNYQAAVCPKLYPICYNHNCMAKSCMKLYGGIMVEDGVNCHATQFSPHPGIAPGSLYKGLGGFDGKNTPCKDNYQVLATCPKLYPDCVRGHCRTEDGSPAHPVWALYTKTPPLTCQDREGRTCNAIRGYDGLGAKCNQNYQACPPLYPYCNIETHDCEIPECRIGCSTTGWATSPYTKPGGRYTRIHGFDAKNNPCTGDYEMRRCPDSYPACFDGDCVIGSCKPGPGARQCAWKNAFVNPLNLLIPEPAQRFNRILGYNGLGDICNDAFEVECPSNYPVCGPPNSEFAGDCVIQKCAEGVGEHAPCSEWKSADKPSQEPWPTSSFNLLHGNGLGKKCTEDYEVTMCPYHYPICSQEGNGVSPGVLPDHEGDCISRDCMGGSCTWEKAPAFNVEPAAGRGIKGRNYNYLSGNDNWGTPCNHNYEEIIVKLIASEQDLLHWITDVKAWHTSLQIGDMEYWYDPEHGGIIKEEPADRGHTSHVYEQSGLVPKRDRNKVTIYEINLGPTARSARVMKRELERLFILPDNGYDIIYRNSNTFTDFALWTLLGYRLSRAWTGNQVYINKQHPVVETMLTEQGYTNFNFQAAEAKIRDSHRDKYGQVRELFRLLGSNLGNNRWYNMYICPFAKEDVGEAWEDPSQRPKSGFAIAQKEPLTYPLTVTVTNADVLARGGANENTKAESVVPKDLKSFLKLLDLLMANCVALLYNQQVKLAEKWYEIDHSEQMNPLSELPPEEQDLRQFERAEQMEDLHSKYGDLETEVDS